jgi:hypothetical protein
VKRLAATIYDVIQSVIALTKGLTGAPDRGWWEKYRPNWETTWRFFGGYAEIMGERMKNIGVARQSANAEPTLVLYMIVFIDKHAAMACLMLQ